MSPKLTADELGNVGEAKFGLLCGEARLICNKSQRDLTGWDFLVEFPMPADDGKVVLDQREPTSCLIQLKSTSDVDRGRISLRLSSIERLAKDPRPALVVVFQCKPEGESIAGYLVHLLGEQLARVLKRLRVAHAANTRDVNHTTISFDYRKVGTAFDLTPEGLRKALIDACGYSQANYVTVKQRQLSELGYEHGGLEFEARVWIEDAEHLNNVLLGLAPLKPEHLSVFDSRFGIRIPYSGREFAEVAEFRFTPPHMGGCEISFRGPPLAPAAVFAAQAHIGPPIAEVGGPHLLIRHPDFLLRLQPGALNFETEDVVAVSRPLRRWNVLIRALNYLASGQGSLTIAGLGSIQTLHFPMAIRLDGPSVKDLPPLNQFLEGWQRLLDIAGVKSNADFSLETIKKSSLARAVVDLLLNPSPTVRLELQDVEGTQSELFEVLLFGTCSMADAAITYCAKVTFEPTHDVPWSHRASTFTKLDIRPAVDDEEAYCEQQRKQHGLQHLINHEHFGLN